MSSTMSSTKSEAQYVFSIKTMLEGALKLVKKVWEDEKCNRLFLAIGQLEEAIVLLDNASSQKELELDLKDVSSAWLQIWLKNQKNPAMFSVDIRNALRDSITNIAGRMSDHSRDEFECILMDSGIKIHQEPTRSQFWKSYRDQHKDLKNAIPQKRKPRKGCRRGEAPNRQQETDAVDSQMENADAQFELDALD